MNEDNLTYQEGYNSLKNCLKPIKTSKMVLGKEFQVNFITFNKINIFYYTRYEHL